MIEGVHSDTEFQSHSQSLRVLACALLELTDAGPNVFSEQILHLITEHLLTCFLMIGDPSKTNKFPIIYV